MNISQDKTIILTDKEWDEIDADAKKRMKGVSASYYFLGKKWTFRFHGITDKQTMTELCADFGLKVTG